MKHNQVGPARFWPKVVWAGAVVAALFAGFMFGQHTQSGDQASRFEALQTRFDVTVAQMGFDMAKLSTQRDALQSQLLVEQTTRSSLEATLNAAQSDLASARERLAFYEQLLPPGPAGEVTVRAFDIEPRAGLLSYRVLLMRNGTAGSGFNGLMEFVANGVQKGKNVKITLKPAAGAGAGNAQQSQTTPLQLSFDQFQRAEGLLGLPEGFAPRSVTLNVMEGSAVRATRTVNLATD